MKNKSAIAVVLIAAAVGTAVWAYPAVESGGYLFFPAIKVTGNGTGKSVIVPNADKICLDGVTACMFSVSANTGSDLMTLTTTGSGRVDVSGRLSAEGQFFAGLGSTNSVSIAGATASNPVTFAAAGTNAGYNFTTTGSGVWQFNGVNMPNGAVDSYFGGYDSISTVGTGTILQSGATASAMTVADCNYIVLTAAVGTGTETIELCSSTGITTGNCTGTKYCTCSLTSGNAARSVVACTINTAAVAKGVTPTWVETADTIATSDAIGNMVAHFTSP